MENITKAKELLQKEVTERWVFFSKNQMDSITQMFYSISSLENIINTIDKKMKKVTKEWEMVTELLKEVNSGAVELHDNHLVFINELYEYMDPYEPIKSQCPEWKINKLYWLYDWKLNGEYVPEAEYGQ
jgi:DNA phosphorothioation-dependent restriction protein DptG